MKSNYYLKRININDFKMNAFRFFEKRKQNKLYTKWKMEIDNEVSSKKVYTYNPLVSIIVPVFNVESKLLIECIESVINQNYSNWELCIADDASTLKSVKEILSFYQKKDSRINVVYRKKNGHICQATNSALEVAKGEFIAFLDNDDFLATNALSSIVEALNIKKTYDFLYTDEDKFCKNKFFEPAFKPDWSPQLFLSTNYTSHFSVFRKKIVDQIGGLKDDYIGAQDYDFVLRFTEKISSADICHIPKVLYHWRVTPHSTASTPNAKGYANEAGKRALQSALNRRGIKGNVKQGFAPGFYEIDYLKVKETSVTVIYVIKSSDMELNDILKKVEPLCDENVVEIFLVFSQKSNGQFKNIEKLSTKNSSIKINILHFESENLLSLYNRAAKEATGDILLFSNNFIEFPKKKWIDVGTRMLYLDSVGSASGTIIDGKNNVLASGWHINVHNKLVPFYKKSKSYSKGYFGRLKIPTNVSVGEKNIFMMKKNVYDSIGGFDEKMSETDSVVKFFLDIINLGYENIRVPSCHFVSNKKSDYTEKGIEDITSVLNNENQYFEDPFINNEFTLKI
ncbi:glycosyltransferase [Enterococcus devriesei]|uniref:glycosyltransferase family 2 protein n=1 Tax=Enterococcus devriesei TaxID=319970 RepID=UPI001C103182|nr:glycosyltransferase [Enterococcus devriesei]MBU5364193.1 glycosyltransferase [Enterococcus devriesei]